MDVLGSAVAGFINHEKRRHEYAVNDVSFYLNGATQNKNLDLDDMLPKYQGSPAKIIHRLVLYVCDLNGTFGSLKCYDPFLIYDDYGNFEYVPANTQYVFTQVGRYYIVKAG